MNSSENAVRPEEADEVGARGAAAAAGEPALLKVTVSRRCAEGAVVVSRFGGGAADSGGNGEDARRAASCCVRDAVGSVRFVRCAGGAGAAGEVVARVAPERAGGATATTGVRASAWRGAAAATGRWIGSRGGFFGDAIVAQTPIVAAPALHSTASPLAARR